MDFVFLLSSVLLGAGLAMDAFSVSLANGFHEPGMGWKKNQFYGGHFCILPVAYAYGGMDLCAYHCGNISILCILYSVDSLFPSLFHRRKDGERRIFR